MRMMHEMQWFDNSELQRNVFSSVLFVCVFLTFEYHFRDAANAIMYVCVV